MSIELFSYGQDRIRTSEENGEPWFVAQDILEILDLNRSSLASLDDEEKGVHTMDTLGGRQKVATINESGLYSLILRSRKPEAKAFKRWITGTVLPTIRKTGAYSTAPALTGPALMAAALIEAQSTLAAKDAVIAELEPKAELAENYLTASVGSRLVGEAAKILGMKEKQLRAFLLAEKLIFVKHATCGNVLYDHYSDFAPHFEARETVVNHTWGSCNHYTLRITPRGIDLIRKRLRDQEEAA
ncbi:phage antirepressor KilAC domain-containing protein [Rhodococcus qingshengii]|uniref:phage antirepressor n=1 Tax=Rhodococcus qingshengii TaxID=334542 RepID=UPI002112127B|nr:BRO family protein [Rhodococcus qingshengii]UUE23847.1 phage antirepressor KilAC domain-containing protein [Rhodococcus qingshengii]